jgi:hypothetical protein
MKNIHELLDQLNYLLENPELVEDPDRAAHNLAWDMVNATRPEEGIK